MEGRARSGRGRRWPRRALAIALLAAGAIVAAALVDYAITSSALPELDPSATLPDPDIAERGRLGDGYETRGWFYALGLLLVIAGLVVIAVRAGAEGRRERFADLGVAGVAIGVVTWIVVAQEPTLFADDGGESAIWIPAVALLLAAGVGTLLSRRPEVRTPPPAVAPAAVGLAALVSIPAPVVGLVSILAAACLS